MEGLPCSAELLEAMGDRLREQGQLMGQADWHGFMCKPVRFQVRHSYAQARVASIARQDGKNSKISR